MVVYQCPVPCGGWRTARQFLFTRWPFHAVRSLSLVVQDLKDKSVDTLLWHTPERIVVKPVYTEADTAKASVSQVPGEC